MPKYWVAMEDSVRVDVWVEADTPEEAVAKAVVEKGKEQKVEVLLRPTAVGEGDDGDEITGKCDGCGSWITERNIEGQPYNYGCVGERCDEILCYVCCEKAKAAGDAE